MTKLAQPDAARSFLSLHQTKPGFVLPNAWDPGSAIILQQAGFPAIATTSGGIAFSLGKPDYHMGDIRIGVSRAQMFTRIREMVEAVAIPVSADLEAGYGDAPEEVAETIRMAIASGLAGGNIEDRVPGEARLYDEGLAVERIRAAREAIQESGKTFVLNARSDAFLITPDPLRTAVRRCNLYREAGADCVFVPGPAHLVMVRVLVQEIEAPVNVVNGLGEAKFAMAALLDAGVQRITLGASIARAALGFVRAAAREVREAGTVGYAVGQIPQGELNAMFVKARQDRRGPQPLG